MYLVLIEKQGVQIGRERSTFRLYTNNFRRILSFRREKLFQTRLKNRHIFMRSRIKEIYTWRDPRIQWWNISLAPSAPAPPCDELGFREREDRKLARRLLEEILLLNWPIFVMEGNHRIPSTLNFKSIRINCTCHPFVVPLNRRFFRL